MQWPTHFAEHTDKAVPLPKRRAHLKGRAQINTHILVGFESTVAPDGPVGVEVGQQREITVAFGAVPAPGTSALGCQRGIQQLLQVGQWES